MQPHVREEDMYNLAPIDGLHQPNKSRICRLRLSDFLAPGFFSFTPAPPPFSSLNSEPASTFASYLCTIAVLFCGLPQPNTGPPPFFSMNWINICGR